MFFERLSDKIIVVNLFGKTTIQMNVTIQEDHDNISQLSEEELARPAAKAVKKKDNEQHNDCPICHNTPCECEASGDGNFVL